MSPASSVFNNVESVILKYMLLLVKFMQLQTIAKS